MRRKNKNELQNRRASSCPKGRTMGSSIKNVITRREYDFTDIQTGTKTASVVVLRSVDVTYGETAELCVRVHSNDNSIEGDVRVVAKPISLTPEEPETDFLADAVAIASVGASAAGTLVLDSFTEPFGNAVQLVVEGVKYTTDGTLKATISVDIVMRD